MNKKLFIVVEAIIYVCFIILDLLLSIDSTYIKYLGIILCLLFSLYNKSLKLFIAMFFTMLADLFLLVINDYYEIGLLFFIITQLTYLIYLTKLNNYKKFLLLRLIVFLFGLIILYFVDYINLLNILVILYFSNLLINTLQSFTSNMNLLKIGLFLFVCCDVCVGLHNILNYGLLYDLVTLFMWIFYLPSQVLISLNFIENK